MVRLLPWMQPDGVQPWHGDSFSHYGWSYGGPLQKVCGHCPPPGDLEELKAKITKMDLPIPNCAVCLEIIRGEM